jgi:hypothetical protein
MNKWNPAPERNIGFFPKLGNSKMKGFGRLFEVRKDGRNGIRITIFEKVFIKFICDLWTIAIIHGPYMMIRLNRNLMSAQLTTWSLLLHGNPQKAGSLQGAWLHPTPSYRPLLSHMH